MACLVVRPETWKLECQVVIFLAWIDWYSSWLAAPVVPKSQKNHQCVNFGGSIRQEAHIL